MAKIKDFKESTPRRASATHTWAWEVIVQEYDERSGDFVDNIAARFFDPWKAVQYGIDKYNGACMVQVVLLHTDNLKAE